MQNSTDKDVFHADATFESLGLRSSVLKGVTSAGFDRPTDIQGQLIPEILNGHDVLGQARTGTGKTAAFALPLLHLVNKDDPIQALVLVPTRELALQVVSEIKSLGAATPITVVAILGGESMGKQIAALERGPQIVVGTPGRVQDLHDRRKLPYDGIKFAVLDEVDRMLDIGFRDDIRRILGRIPTHPQTIFVSATISPDIEQLAKKYLNDAVKITTSTGSLTVSQVDQSYLTVEQWDKTRLLVHLLTHEEADLTLVFCRTKVTVDRLQAHLKKKGIDAFAIHGDMPQGKRNSIMRKLRSGRLSVVVASDLAARGLDVSGISHVINFDLPEDPEVYIHRIGRTARVGRKGIAWSFVAPEQGKLLTEIEKLANTHIPIKEYPDFTPGPLPKNVEREREEAETRKDNLQQINRNQLGAPVWEKETKTVDPDLFPGGVMPTKPPKRILGGRAATRRRAAQIKASMHSTKSSEDSDSSTKDGND
ncbi:MAG: DEAD/DEAH box helicase [Planctomycetes bacterium]|nr:DEAD/DEAH box helicase [Planctomycetota bacterium]